IVLELQLCERGPHDRRGRLCGARARELALGGEGQTADAGAAVARSLADQQEACVLAPREVAGETTPQQARARPFAIEVEGGADLGSGQLLDEADGSHSDGPRAAAARDRAGDLRLARRGPHVARS